MVLTALGERVNAYPFAAALMVAQFQLQQWRVLVCAATA